MRISFHDGNILRTEIKSFVFNFFLSIGLMAGIYFLAYFRPIIFTHIIAEDSYGEFGTFCFYFGAFLFTAGAMIFDRELFKPGYILLSCLFFIVGMEEISWGQRLVHVETPYILQRFNAQSEINIHDFFALPIDVYLSSAVFLWITVFLLLLLKFPSLKNLLTRWGIPFCPFGQIPLFMLSIWFLIFIRPPLPKGEEIGELLLSGAFFLYAGTLCYDRIRKRLNFRCPYSLWIGLGFLMAGIMTGVLVKVGFGIEGFRWRLHKMAERDYPKYGLNTQAEEVFDYIVSHKETKTEESLLEYGRFVKSRNQVKAKAIFEKAFKEEIMYQRNNPKDPNSFFRAAVLLVELKQDGLANGQFQKAIDNYQEKLREAKKDWEYFKLLSSLGEAYYHWGKYPQALEYFQKAQNIATVKRDLMYIEQRIQDTINGSSRTTKTDGGQDPG